MNEILLLIKVTMQGMFDFNKAMRGGNRKDRNSMNGFIGTMVLIFAVCIFYSIYYSSSLMTALTESGAPELTVPFFATVTGLIIAVTTVNKVKGGLFDAKDNSILLALPLRAESIILSRLKLLYIVNLPMLLGLLIPVGIIYGQNTAQSAVYYVLYCLLTLVFPAVPIAVGVVAGSLLAVFTSFFRSPKIVNSCIQLICFAGLMFTAFNLSFNYSSNAMLSTAQTMTYIYPLSMTFLESAASSVGNISSLLIFAGISILVIGALVMIVSKFYFKLDDIISADRTSAKKYSEHNIKTASPIYTMFKREWIRFVNCPPYFINAGAGFIMNILVAVIAVVTVSSDMITEFLAELGNPAELMPAIAAAAFAYMSFIVSPTSSSISLDGKNFWITACSPVSAADILKSKILLALSLGIPANIISAAIAAIGFGMNFYDFLLMLILPSSAVIFSAMIGLAINLKYPQLDWKSEIIVVKQSKACMISVFSGLGMSFLSLTLLAIAALFMPPILVLLTVSALILAVSYIFWKAIMKKADKLMMRVSDC